MRIVSDTAIAPAPWKCIEGGWTRHMFGAESGFAGLATHPSRPGHGTIAVEASFASPNNISSSDFAALLRSAWLSVRFHLHPLIATISSAADDLYDVNGYSLYYPSVNVCSANLWAAETVLEHAPTTITDLVGSLAGTASTARGAKSRLHFAPSIDSPNRVFHVTVILPHFLSDARGCMKILNHILQNLKAPTKAALAWGQEVVKLAVPLSVATGRRTVKDGMIEPPPPAHLQAFVQGMTTMITNSQPIFTKTPGDFTKPRPGRTIIQDLSLSVSDTTALLEACRSRGVTITSLLTVLIVMAWVKYPEALAGYKTVGFPQFPIDKSMDLLDPYKGGVGLNIALVPFLFDARVIESCLGSGTGRFSATWEAAKFAKAQIAAGIAQDVSVTFGHEIIESTIFGKELVGTAEAFYMSANPVLTSVGRLTPMFDQENINGPDTKKEWGVIHVANGSFNDCYSVVIHLWEWQGQTIVRFVGREEYEVERPIKTFKDDLAQLLQDILAFVAESEISQRK